MINKRLVLAMGVVILASSFLISLVRGKPPTLVHYDIPRPDYGNVSELTLRDVNGNMVEIKKGVYKGYIITFWAMWCQPCIKEIPTFKALDKDYRAQGIRIIALSVDEDLAKLRAFVKSEKILYPVVMASQDVQTMFGGIRSIPTTYIVDGDLGIQDRVLGYETHDFFKSHITLLLKETSP